jgi:hypothetical protein
LHDYLDKKMETAFKEDHTVFAGSDFFDRINDVSLARVLAKYVVKFTTTRYHASSTQRGNQFWVFLKGMLPMSKAHTFKKL